MLAAQATRRTPEQSIAVHLPPTPLIHCGIESPTSGDVPTPRKVHRETAGNQALWKRPPADRGQLPLAKWAVRTRIPTSCLLPHILTSAEGAANRQVIHVRVLRVDDRSLSVTGRLEGD